MNEENNFKSGFVALIGKSNVGKSTILNQLVGEKVAIVTSKPETTRDKIQGIYTSDEAQVVFMDTPGMYKPRNLLGKNMMRQIQDALLSLDVVVMVINAKSAMTEEDNIVFELLDTVKKPVIVAINKVDLMRKEMLLPLMEKLNDIGDFKEIVPVSALNGTNMDVLFSQIMKYLPYGEKYYPEDELTDKSVRFMVSEIIREKVLMYTQQEVPHSVCVLIEDFKEAASGDKVDIRAEILVEKRSQKKIIVGKDAKMLLKIRHEAKKDARKLLEKKVAIDLWVKIKENWRKDPLVMKALNQQSSNI